VIAAALLHDTVEDTGITAEEIRAAFGNRVAQLVLEVTDPVVEGNRAFRKQAAQEHLARSSAEGATIKLADLIDNTSSIVKYDKGFARKYLTEKERLLEVLRHGSTALWQRASEVLVAAQRELVQASLEP
jgi:(p)ppGpp synthase/HD superfamily hydrolase